ncbi:MAG TPA: hypothetical protein VLA94_00500, partial [Syntrophales bacterium]|nr:hypothetical protein [Syntrophales bacterium]
MTDREGDVGEGDVGLAGAEYVLEPRLPDDERPPPARAKTSSGIRKLRKKNSVKSISPFITQRFVDITPPDLAQIGLSGLFCSFQSIWSVWPQKAMISPCARAMYALSA